MRLRYWLYLLVGILVIFQYQLWFGKYGLIRLSELNDQIDTLTQENQELQARNEALYAQVRELSEGTEVLEERARSRLGFVKEGEQFIQVLPPKEDDSSD